MRVKGFTILLIFTISLVTLLNSPFTDFSSNENESLILLTLPAFVSSPGDFDIDKDNKEIGSIRDMIYQKIVSQPGIHFRKLCRELNKKNGVVYYHLQFLESSENRVKSHRDGGFTRYFPVEKRLPGISSDYYHDLLSVLQRPTMSMMIDLLRNADNGLSRKKLSSELGISVQAVTYNCKKLSVAGIIEETCSNRQKYYVLAVEAQTILEQLDKAF
ncbi:MAG: winged helix-turn-helix transcriptional regulator [Candidatus Hodarchaeales archaeon]